MTAEYEPFPPICPHCHQIDKAAMRKMVDAWCPRSGAGDAQSRARMILYLRFGLAGRPMGLEELGAVIGFTRERVRQIELTAIRAVRAGLK